MYAVTGICRYWESDSVQSYRNPTDCMKFDRVLRRTEGVENTEIRKEKKRIQVTPFVFKSIQVIEN